MAFHDTDQQSIGCTSAPEPDDLAGMKSFIDNINVELLIIHCGTGISRSSALAAAISEYLGICLDVFNNHRYIPNRLVYRLARQELGISKSRELYEKLFGEQCYGCTDI